MGRGVGARRYSAGGVRHSQYPHSFFKKNMGIISILCIHKKEKRNVFSFTQVRR